MNKKSIICIGFNCNCIKLWIKCGFSNCAFAELWHVKYFSGRVALFLTKWGRETIHLGQENSDFTKVSVNSHASQKLTSDISKFCHLCNELMGSAAGKGHIAFVFIHSAVFYNIVKVRQSPSVFIQSRAVLKSVRASYDLRQVNVRDLFTLKLSLVDCHVPSAIILVWRAMCNSETKFLS